MRIASARQITPIVLTCGLLVGCGGVSRLDSNPSKSVDLSGSWILDRAASDDPKLLLDKLRPKPARREPSPDEETGDDSGDQPAGPQGGGPQGGGRSRRGGQAQSQPQMVYRNNNEAFTHSTVMKVLQADVARAESLTIRQTPERFSLDYGSMVRTFTPGSVSVVSADWGVADQSSGWKGKDFVIHIKPQSGVASVETFNLAEDGAHLIEQLNLGGGAFPSIKLRRVYDRTDKPLPRAVPTND